MSFRISGPDLSNVDRVVPGQEQTPEQRPCREVSLGQGPEVIRKSSEEPRKILSAVHR